MQLLHFASTLMLSGEILLPPDASIVSPSDAVEHLLMHIDFARWISRVGGLVAFIGAIKFALSIKSEDAREQLQAALIMVSCHWKFGRVQYAGRLHGRGGNAGISLHSQFHWRMVAQSRGIGDAAGRRDLRIGGKGQQSRLQNLRTENHGSRRHDGCGVRHFKHIRAVRRAR